MTNREFIYPEDCIDDNHPRFETDEVIGIVNTMYSIFYRGIWPFAIRKCSICGKRYIDMFIFQM